MIYWTLGDFQPVSLLELYLHGKSQIVILGPNSIEVIRRNLDEVTQLEMLKALGFGTKQFYQVLLK